MTSPARDTGPAPTTCAIIGSGLQAGRLGRAAVAAGSRVAYVVGNNPETCAVLAADLGASVVDYDVVLSDPAVTAVVVTTPPDCHAYYAIRAIEADKHVLCEKPLTLTMDDAEKLMSRAEEARRTLWCAFNHRYHSGFRRLQQLVGAETVYELRIAYGIAGTPALAGTWRRAGSRVAGGHLMEQGIHAVDLALQLVPTLDRVAAVTQQRVIESRGGPLEDSATVLLADPDGAAAALQVSLLQWVNLFRLEVVTSSQYLEMRGLGAAYGEQTLTRYPRADGHPFAGETTHFRGPDQSWAGQWRAFCEAMESGRHGDAATSLPALAAVFAAYEAARRGRWVPLGGSTSLAGEDGERGCNANPA